MDFGRFRMAFGRFRTPQKTSKMFSQPSSSWLLAIVRGGGRGRGARRPFVSFREILYDFVYTGLQPRRYRDVAFLLLAAP